MSEAAAVSLNFEASDLTGQNNVRVRKVRPDSTMGDVVRSLVTKMRLGSKDPQGRELTYQARLEREGRHVHASELVGDALREGDRIQLHPNVDAGAGFGLPSERG